MKNKEIIDLLKEGNKKYVSSTHSMSHTSLELRKQTALEGQNPLAIVIACSDSRVMPNSIFSADLGSLFVIRVAGNVLDNHQLGSIEYAAAHLNVKLIIMLGHTGCGAIKAAIHGETDGYIKYITDDIEEAIGDEKDDHRATVLNALHGVNVIKKAFAEHPEIGGDELEVIGAVYDIVSGEVEFLE